jgi:hypothetical protein
LIPTAFARWRSPTYVVGLAIGAPDSMIDFLP